MIPNKQMEKYLHVAAQNSHLNVGIMEKGNQE